MNMQTINKSQAIVKGNEISSSYTITKCQICDNQELTSVMFLGYMPPVNQLRSITAQKSEQPSYPTELLLCRKCNLVQLSLILHQKVLFPLEYPYRSGTTKILCDNFANLYAEAVKLIKLEPDSLIVDIGSNDGTLLSNFKDKHKVLGIEPTNVSSLAVSNGIETIQEYFSKQLAENILMTYGKAKIITAANVFAHIENIHQIIEGIIMLLDKQGVFISESHYLLSLIDSLQYDTIYHEHLRYYSIHSLQYLFNQHGLEIFHAQKIPTHGGSIRIFAAKKGDYPINEELKLLLEQEPINQDLLNKLQEFKSQVILSKLKLHTLFKNIKEQNGRIFGISAPSRASTLINYTGIDDGILDCVVEVTGSLKIGKYMPGTIIPVVDERELYKSQPEYALLLSWHIAEELIRNLRLKGYQGKFIIPLKEVAIVE